VTKEHELDPEPVPDRIDLEPESVGAGAADGASPGVRKVTR